MLNTVKPYCAQANRAQKTTFKANNGSAAETAGDIEKVIETFVPLNHRREFALRQIARVLEPRDEELANAIRNRVNT